MAYTIHNAEGKAVGGDRDLDDVVKAVAMLVGGYVTDDDGNMVYESTAYQQAREAE